MCARALTVRFFLSLFFVILVITSGTAVVVFSTAGPGSWSLGLSLPWATEPAIASQEPAAENSAQLPSVTVLKGQPIGDWLFNCGTNPQTAKKQCTIAQQLTDKRTQSVVFAWLIGDDGQGNLVAVWQTPTGVLVNRGVILDVGTDRPIAVPFTSCISGHCEAIASLAPDFIETLSKATKATATVFTVAGEGLTFSLSVNGLAQAIDAVKAPMAG
jgi:invasion protein IalB